MFPTRNIFTWLSCLNIYVTFLLLGVAYRNNKVTQRKIAEEGGIPVLVNLLINPPNEDIKVEVAMALGCVVLSNKENQEKLQEEPGFKFNILLALFRSKDRVCLDRLYLYFS